MTKAKVRKGSATRGVRQHANGWLVEHGTNPRVRAYFRDRDIAVAYKAHLVATNTSPELRLDRKSFLASAGSLSRQTRAVTPSLIVSTGLGEKTKRHPVSVRQWESHARAALRGFELLGLAIEHPVRPLARDLGDRLVAVMRSEFPATTVKNAIRLLDLGGVGLWKAGKLPFNPFAETNTSVEYTVSKRTWSTVAPAMTVEQGVQVLRALPAHYRPVMILMMLTGMRIAEAMALTVGDVNTEQRLLSISKQRSGSGASIRERTKSASSTRMIPIGDYLSGELARYLDITHGPAPTDTTARTERNARLLFVGQRGDAMDPRTVTDNIGAARRRVRLDGDTLRAQVKPTHDCRAMFITECSSQPDLASALLSRYVGHKTIRGGDGISLPAAEVTGAYNRPGIRHLREFVEHLEAGFVARFIAGLGAWDPLDEDSFIDPVSAAEAKRLLAVDDTRLQTLCSEGSVVGVLIGGDMLFERAAIITLRENLDRTDAVSFSRTEALARLAINDRTLQELIESGVLRVHATGAGERISRGDVDNLVELWAERIVRARSWLRVSQTAELLGCSADTVRRLSDEGHLPSWIDPCNGRKERFIDPMAVEHLMRNRPDITTDAVAREFKVTRTQVEAALFRVRSERGTSGSRNALTREEFDAVAVRLPARRRKTAKETGSRQRTRTVRRASNPQQ